MLTSLPLFFYKANPPRDVGAEIEDADSELNEELINNSTASSQMSFGSSIWELPALLLRKRSNIIKFNPWASLEANFVLDCS